MEQRSRYIKEDEMPKFAAAIEEEKNIYLRNLFWMYLFTGFRKQQLLTLKWSDINWVRNEIHIAKTKSGREHYIPLLPEMIELLKDIPPVDNNPYIFVGHLEGKHFVNIEKPWKRIQKRAGIEDVKIYDLRRTCGSWVA